jgi:hypothetical protein
MVSKLSALLAITILVAGTIPISQFAFGANETNKNSNQANTQDFQKHLDKLCAKKDQKGFNGFICQEISGLQNQVNTLTTSNTALQNQVNTLTTSNTALQNQVNTLTTSLQNEVADFKAYSVASEDMCTSALNFIKLVVQNVPLSNFGINIVPPISCITPIGP